MQKQQRDTPSIPLSVANFFGFLGYVSILLEWFWVGGLLLYPSIKNGDLDWVVPAVNPTPAPVIVATPISPISVLISVIVTILCFVSIIYAIYKIPQTIGKAGAKLTHSTAGLIVPSVTRHKNINKKTLRILTFKLTVAIKAVAIVIPVLVALLTPSFLELDKTVVILTVTFIALCGTFDFGIQLLIAKLAKLQFDRIW